MHGRRLPRYRGDTSTALPSPYLSKSRRRLAAGLFAVAFGTNVPTPLLLIYQVELDLSTWTVTALFAVYSLALLPALLWGGPASDVIGRRRLMVAAVGASGLASALFIIGASNLALLFAGRVLLGAVSGIAFVVGSAWMQELAESHERTWAVRLTGMVMYAGFGLGPLISGAIGQWGPSRLMTPYLVHIALVVVGLAGAMAAPETVSMLKHRRIRPDLGLSRTTRGPFWRVVAPTALGVFGFASLAFGLFPVLLRPAMADVAVFVAGFVAAITALTIFATQGVLVRLGTMRAATTALASGAVGCGLGMAAFLTGWWGLLFAAAVALGAASGLAVTAGLRFVDILAEPARRGAMTGAFYAVAYVGGTAPVVVSTLAGVDRYGIVLGGITLLAGVGALALRRSVRSFPGFTDEPAVVPPSV
jgi:MFS family permease